MRHVNLVHNFALRILSPGDSGGHDAPPVQCKENHDRHLFVGEVCFKEEGHSTYPSGQLIFKHPQWTVVEGFIQEVSIGPF